MSQIYLPKLGMGIGNDYTGENIQKIFVLSLILLILLFSAILNSRDLSQEIERKYINYGVLTFAQKEISRSLLVDLIDKQKSFSLIDLNIRVIEEILKNKNQNYQIKTDRDSGVEKRYFVDMQGAYDAITNPMFF